MIMELDGEREAVLGREGNGNTGQQRPEYLLRGLPWLWGEKFQSRKNFSNHVSHREVALETRPYESYFVVSSDSGL